MSSDLKDTGPAARFYGTTPQPGRGFLSLVNAAVSAKPGSTYSLPPWPYVDLIRSGAVTMSTNCQQPSGCCSKLELSHKSRGGISTGSQARVADCLAVAGETSNPSTLVAVQHGRLRASQSGLAANATARLSLSGSVQPAFATCRLSRPCLAALCGTSMSEISSRLKDFEWLKL